MTTEEKQIIVQRVVRKILEYINLLSLKQYLLKVNSLIRVKCGWIS